MHKHVVALSLKREVTGSFLNANKAKKVIEIWLRSWRGPNLVMFITRLLYMLWKPDGLTATLLAIYHEKLLL
jgi:hypothetical protein